MSFTLTINNVDFSDYVAVGGFKISFNGVDGSDAGRMLNAEMDRCKIADKRKLEVTLVPIPTATTPSLLAVLLQEYVTVTYIDPGVGGTTTKTMYSNNVDMELIYIMDDDTWTGFTFPLIEK